MSLSELEFIDWINIADKHYDHNILTSLAKGFRELKPINENYCGRDIFINSISENPKYGIARNMIGSIGWLVYFDGSKYIREINPPTYEEEYFEGDKLISGGYGKYLNQSIWRLQKSYRQLDEIIIKTNLSNGSVLDVGSGYGYFRKALEDKGFKHQGLEISEFARKITKELYGFDTLSGYLSDYVDQFSNTFDLITMWDVIEHIADYEGFLQDAAKMLKPGGYLIVKTPNINCPEVDVFGPHYHSFKREHLVYFSHNGLADCARKVGLNLFYSKSISHLLVGFVGESITNEWANKLRGSDLVIYLQKK
jgi:2-polyprenyl-3-methyl-5-hydroxy-6-metoxy-1,4-benzoquinol methylase